MEPYKNKIIEYINAGFTLTETIKQLKKQGYKGKTSSIRMYISDIIKKYGLKAEKYISKASADMTCKISKVVYIIRNEFFSHFWLNTKIFILRSCLHLQEDLKKIFVLWKIPLFAHRPHSEQDMGVRIPVPCRGWQNQQPCLCKQKLPAVVPEKVRVLLSCGSDG